MRAPLSLDYPFRGRWRTYNSPASRVPSHGTAQFGLSYAIDFVPVDDDGRSAPFTLRSLFSSESPARFPGFGRPVTAPVDGRVLRAHGAEPDHEAFRGFPSVGYMATQGRRLARGVEHVLGNHVVIETPDGADASAFVVLCHLQRNSLTVKPGDLVRRGDLLGRCGNSGNSTEPHLHLHVLDRDDLRDGQAVPITFGGDLPRNNEIIEIA